MEHMCSTDGKNNMMENDNEYEIPHQPCPFEDCGSSDAFSYNTEKMTGFCFACDRGYPRSGMELTEWARDTYPLQEKEGYTTMAVAPTPTELLTAETREFRGVTVKTMDFYGVQTLVGQDGEAKKQAYNRELFTDWKHGYSGSRKVQRYRKPEDIPDKKIDSYKNNYWFGSQELRCVHPLNKTKAPYRTRISNYKISGKNKKIINWEDNKTYYSTKPEDAMVILAACLKFLCWFKPEKYKELEELRQVRIQVN